MPGLSRLPVQPEDAGGRVPREARRRRARDDGGRGLGVPGRRAARPPLARRPAGRGLDYLRLGQSATELSGGGAQRIKLATELQRAERGTTLDVPDEPTTGLHPADVERLLAQFDGLVESGNTVVVVEHDLRVVATSDWVIDVGPGAGDEGGRVVAAGRSGDVARAPGSRTAPYLASFRG